MKKLLLVLMSLVFLFSCTVLNKKIIVYNLSKVKTEVSFVNEDKIPVKEKELDFLIRREWVATIVDDNGKDVTITRVTDTKLVKKTDSNGKIKINEKMVDLNDDLEKYLKENNIKNVKSKEVITKIWIFNSEYAKTPITQISGKNPLVVLIK